MSGPQLPTRERLAACRILVVGDVMLDRYWHGEVARISPEAPVPVVHVRREENRPGGAANVALNIQTLGAQATLLSMVGQDEAARSLQALLVQHGIRADEAPPVGVAGGQPDRRPLFDPSADHSVRWHRAYGPARQVEVLREKNHTAESRLAELVTIARAKPTSSTMLDSASPQQLPTFQP